MSSLPRFMPLRSAFLSSSRNSLALLFCLVSFFQGAVLLNTGLAEEFDRPPINYRDGVPQDNISRLQAMIDEGKLELQHDPDSGYLKSVLNALKIPVESQMLVFSKTSLQGHRITPKTPRALYFNDDVYIGYIPFADVLEISATDPQLGTVYYTLEQEASEKPQFIRQTDMCLICHGSSRTENVPGHVVRSMLVERSGQPLFSSGSFSVNHTTPFENRWGGWYVTGTHGKQTHLGNLVLNSRIPPAEVKNEEGHNVTDLSDRFKTERYLTGHSDIIALMLLEHQTFVHNRLVKANFAARQALHYQETINETLGQPDETRYDSTTRRIHNAGDELIEALLLVDEAPLTEQIAGTSGYAEIFQKAGPRDRAGRSLRDLDMSRRMFKYPCSYLIYSDAFAALSPEVREYVWQKLWDILTRKETSKETSEKFAHLSAEDRQAILEILQDTHPDLPDYWQGKTAESTE